MESLKGQRGESKRALHLFYCSRDKLNSGGQHLWKVAFLPPHALNSGPIIPFGAKSRTLSDISERPNGAPPVRQESNLGFFFF